MLTGQRAFAGPTTPDVLEAVVKTEPDWSALPAAAPFDLSPDGKRVAVITPTQSTESNHDMTFLFNFVDDLRRRVPIGK